MDYGQPVWLEQGTSSNRPGNMHLLGWTMISYFPPAMRCCCVKGSPPYKDALGELALRKHLLREGNSMSPYWLETRERNCCPPQRSYLQNILPISFMSFATGPNGSRILLNMNTRLAPLIFRKMMHPC